MFFRLTKYDGFGSGDLDDTKIETRVEYDMGIETRIDTGWIRQYEDGYLDNNWQHKGISLSKAENKSFSGPCLCKAEN